MKLVQDRIESARVAFHAGSFFRSWVTAEIADANGGWPSCETAANELDPLPASVPVLALANLIAFHRRDENQFVV